MNNITLNRITNKQLNSLLLFLCLILTCPGVCARADTKIEVTGISTGPDWSLPDGVHSSDRAGGLYMDQDPDYSFLCLKGITLSWANLNPAENQYDFF